MSSGSPVESVRRAFALLEELNRQRINSVQHLHEVTALPKSTIVRLLETLRLLGYVANDPRQGGYQVTSGVRALSSGFHGDPGGGGGSFLGDRIHPPAQASDRRCRVRS